MLEPLRISFTLTRLQRILNPLEGLIAVFFSFAMLLIVPVTVFAECLSKGSSLLDGMKIAAFLVVEGIVAALVLLFFRNPLFTFCYACFGKRYINTLVVEDDRVLFGVDEPKAAVNRRLLVVGRGLLGTVVIRHPYRFSITVPRDAASLAELREAIERDDSIWRDFWAGRIRSAEHPSAKTTHNDREAINFNTGLIAAPVDSGGGMNESLRLSFTLTPLQRLLNPWKKFAYVCTGVVVTIIVLLGSSFTLFIAFSGLFGKTSGWARSVNSVWPPLLALTLLVVFFLLLDFGLVGLVLVAFRGLMFGTRYINTLVVEGDHVFFGVDEPQMALNRKLLRVGRGLCGTIVVRDLHGHSITLPRSAVSISDLRGAIEGRRSEERGEGKGLGSR